MRPRQPTLWLNRFAWFTAAATLFLICSGGMVTSKSVGLAVPDWPTTFGYNMFLFPVSKWVGGVFFEHTHRLIASTVGFLTILLAVWIWCVEKRPWVKYLGLYAVVGVVLQGILGGLRVTMLKDEIGIFHACLAQAFLGLVVFIALVTTDFWRRLSAGNGARLSRTVLRLALLTTIAIYLQLALGATMRHQHRDLAILDFPTANGLWLPDTSAPALAAINSRRDAQGLSDVTAFQIWLQMAHRFGALLIALGLTSCVVKICSRNDKLRMLRRLALAWVILLAGQITLGAWTIWSDKAADVATAHVAVGATMLSLGVIVCAIAARVRWAAPDEHLPCKKEGVLVG
jgi:cytochrome c oxidase assembly protein subunit 15